MGRWMIGAIKYNQNKQNNKLKKGNIFFNKISNQSQSTGLLAIVILTKALDFS